jgi:hypothetical protein
MDTSRREFFGQASVLSLIIGFPRLVPARDKGPAEDWLAKAVERMKAESKPGVVLRVPEKPEARRELALRLVKLLDSTEPRVRQVFCEAVFVCLVPDDIKAAIADSKPAETVVLIDADRRRIEGAEMATADFADADAFRSKMFRLLHGEDNRRLEARAKAQSSPEALAALVKLGSEVPEERDRASAVLRKDCAVLVPAMILHYRKTEDLETRTRIDLILKEHYAAFSDQESGPRLPYGMACQVPVPHGGCGAPFHWDWEDERNCTPKPAGLPPPACGMAAIPQAPARKFIKFLSR